MTTSARTRTRVRRGRPKSKPGNIRRIVLVSMVTVGEAEKIRADSQRRGYNSVSTYIRDMLIRVVPQRTPTARSKGAK